MDEYWRNFLLIQDQIKRMLGPQIHFQNQIQNILDAQRFDLSKYAEPYGNLAAQFERQLFPLVDLKRQMEQITRPSYAMDASIRNIVEPQLRLQEQIDKLLGPQVRKFEHLKSALSPERFTFGDIERLLNPLSQFVDELASAEMHLSETGSLFVDGQEVTLEEIDKAAEKIQNAESDAEFVQQLLDALYGLAAPVRLALGRLILPFFLAIIANMTTPIFEDWWQEYSNLEPRVAKKEIVREARKQYSPDELVGYRFVYATLLHVREVGRKDSEIIDTLPLGKVVKLLKREQSWSFIEYEGAEGGETLQGWVFSRYLMKFQT